MAAKLILNPRDLMARCFFPQATVVVVSMLFATATIAQQSTQFDVGESAVDARKSEKPRVVQLRQQAASGDFVQAAEAVAEFARIGNWADVDEILGRISDQKPDDAAIAKMLRQIGPVVLPQLNRNKLLNQSALNFVAEMKAVLAKMNDDPQVVQLRQRAATGDNIQVAEAATALVRIGNWFVADEILARAATQKRDDATASEMARRIGPALLVRMSRSNQLNQPALEFVSQLSATLAKANIAPTRLQQAIDDLDSENIDDQLPAIRTLLSGGESSIRELVAAIVSETPTADLDTMLRTMLRLGDGGVLALRQVALYGASDERSRALAALARFDRSRFTADFVAAYHAADATQQERATAAEALQRMQLSMPSKANSLVYLSDELERASDAASRASGDDTISSVWDVQENRKSVQSVETFTALAAAHARADAAARLRRIGSLTTSLQQDALIADVSYRVSVDPLWGDEQQVKSIRAAYGDSLSPAVVSGAIADALRRQDWPAVVGLVQLVNETSNQLEVAQWLGGQAGQPSPLVAAAIAPIPRVRYEAATAIARLKPETAYASSSLVRGTLAEMSRLTRRPVAILVETLPEMIDRQETFLTTIGFQVDTVVSVAELERRIATGGDFRLVLSKSGLADARPIELVDRVRRLPRGEQLPIVFYTEEEDLLGPNVFSVPTIQIPAPLSTTPITQLITHWQRVGSLPPLVEGERTLFRTIGREALGLDESAP